MSVDVTPSVVVRTAARVKMSRPGKCTPGYNATFIFVGKITEWFTIINSESLPRDSTQTYVTRHNLYL
jgi:hypothetical protein